MEKVFEDLKAGFEKQFLIIQTKTTQLSWLRTILFIALAALLIYYFKSGVSEAVIIAVLIAIAFYYSVNKHQALESKKTYFENLIQINKEELDRISLKLNQFDPGVQFIEENHPYQIDLDIFGKHSLFQLINRCALEDSKFILAGWLSNPSNERVILSRQNAIIELAKKLDWRQDFQAKNNIAVSKKKKHQPTVSAKDIIDWTNTEEQFNKPKLWKTIAIILGLTTLIAGYLIIIEDFTYQFYYPILLLNGIFLGLGIRHLNKLSKGIDKGHYLISSYSKALSAIEQATFESPYLKDLQNQIRGEKTTATTSINKLAKLTHRLSSRANMLYGLLDICFLLDIHLLIDLHNWKKSYNSDVEKWLNVVSEMECLTSIASFSFANPHYSFAVFPDQQFHFETTQMGHPLISDHEKVRNDYSISNKGSVDIITGSNMSGKSTFQRTVGINMVLAQCGAPVDAKNLKMSITHVFTSMRTKDNLEEHTSSFYAELKRIRNLLDNTEKHASTFFILDEILKGTNSEDRHKGSVALARKLANRNAFGLISTHDLGLGQLAENEKWARNFSFNSEIKNDKIIFDYSLTTGVCKSFNASKLMENMGILDA